MACNLCEAPARTLWVIQGYPKHSTIYNGNWISLQQCQVCNTYWCYSPHEPYASFIFMNVWSYNETTFKQLNFIDNGLILHEWQAAVIRENWLNLAIQEQDLIEAWRGRTYHSFNPIDRGASYSQPKYIEHVADIDKFLNS